MSETPLHSAAGPWAQAWQQLRVSRQAWLGASLLGGIAVACALLPALLSLDPVTTDPASRHLPPTFGHWFGTDALGRDLLARVLVGGRTSLAIGLAATGSAVVIGVFVGALAGLYGGRVDELLMRLVDFLYGVPYMFLVILVMLLFSDTARGDPVPVFLALGLVQWLTMARIVRGQVLSLKEEQFIEAARTIGASRARIIFRHLVPNVLSVVIVYLTLTIPSVMLFEAFLSFLGLGVEPPDVSWGLLANDGIKVITPVKIYWWLVVFPGLALAATLFALNFLGDGLRDALDPRMKNR